MNFTELAFKRIDGSWITTADYIDWANALLQSGCDAPSIAELASCSWDAVPDHQQVERIFQSCLLELGLILPNDFYDALLGHASHICQEMLRGALDPWDCVREMLTLSDDHNEPYMLWIWIDLMRDMAPAQNRDPSNTVFNAALDLQNGDECIRRTAQQFIDFCRMPLPDKFPLVWWCVECEAICDDSTFTERKTCACTKCGAIAGMKNMRFFEHRGMLQKKAARGPF